MTAILGDAESRVPHGALLVSFVDAVLGREDQSLDGIRRDVQTAMGATAFVDVCATVASFNAVVKIADGTGIPLEEAKSERTAALRSELQIDRLRKSDN